MLRRLALSALAAPVLLRPAFAQNQAGQGLASSQAAPATPMQGQMLGSMALSLATAQLAERMGENPAVKAFGALEAEEQAAFTQARQMAGLRVPSIELMTEQQRQMLMQMRDMRGAEFDRAFVRGQVTGHQELLRLHQEAARNPTSREEGMLATVAVPAIKSHLVMLEGVQRTLSG
jgi:putative membrane protein